MIFGNNYNTLMKIHYLNLLLSGMITLFFVSCSSESETKKPDDIKKETSDQVNIPAFNENTAFSYIEKQLSFGTRHPNSPGHEVCKNWIIEELKAKGMKVNTQTFRAMTFKGEKYTGTNIVGHYKPEFQNRILLLAHWDTRFMADMEDGDLHNKPIPGADDGGSGVAVLLALAKLVSENHVNVGIDFLFLDAEDQGEDGGNNPESWCQGAQYYARNLMISANKPQFGILLDMVGAKGATFLKEEISLRYARNIVDKVWAMANGMGYGNYFINQNTTAALDDHLFINRDANIPTVDIIYKTNEGFGDHWHTHRDNIEIIDPATLKAVGQVMTALIYNYAGGGFL